MNKLTTIWILLLLSLTIPVYSQEQGKWTIEKGAKIELPEVGRNFEKITVEQPEPPAEPLNYETHDVDIQLPRLTTRINVVKMTPEPLKKLYGNYVKAGFGNYTTPYLEAFLNNKRSENYAYGLHVRHFSSQNGPVKKISGFSQNRVDGYFRRVTNNVELLAKAFYTHDRYNFYGVNPEVPVSKDTLKNLFSTFHITAGARNLDTRSALLYNINFGYYYFINKYSKENKATEGEFLMNAGTRYKIDNEKFILADFELSASGRTDSAKISRTLFQLKPAFELKKEQYKVIAGFGFAYSNDSIYGSNKAHFYPRVHGEYTILPKTVGVFAGVGGGMQKNTLRTYAQENFYLTSNVPLSHSNKTIELYGGLMGNVSGLNYKVKAAYMSYKFLYFFNNSFTDSSKFTVLYDKATSVVNLEGDLGYELSERFRAGLNLNYFHYTLDTLSAAYHRPGLTTRLSGTYNLYKKIYFNADIYYISGLTGKNFVTNKEVKLKNIGDINLKAEYRVSGVFSAFLELNNILSQKYQRYLYYPVKGFNVIAGITYSF